MKKSYSNTEFFVTILMFCLIITSCNKKGNMFEIVLKIGDIELTKNQYIKNMKSYFGSDKLDTLNGKKLQEFNQFIIDDCFLAADAYNKGFQKNDSILKIVNATADFMLTKYDGYLWKQTKAKEAEVTKEEIKKIYNQPHVIYFLDGLTFEKRLISDTINDYIIEKIKCRNDFDYYYSISDKVKYASKSELMSSWPVYELGQGNEYLKVTKLGDIIGPIRTTAGVLFAKLTKKDIVEKHPFKDESKRLEYFLGMLKTDNISLNEQLKCENLCKPKYNDKNIDKFLVDADNIDFQDQILAEYFISGKIKKLTVFEFKDFMKYYIYGIKMSCSMDVKVNIREKIGMDYLMVEVDSLNLRKDTKYLDEYKDYLRKQVVRQYIFEKIKPDLNNLNNEAKKYYSLNLKLFKEPKYIKVSYFEFDNQSNLLAAQSTIQKALIIEDENMLNDTNLFRGLTDYRQSLIMKRDCTFLSTQNYDYLDRLPMHSLSNTLIQNGKYYLLYKKQESGEIIKPFELVEKIIRNILINKKKESAKQVLLTQLKNKYTIKINKLKFIKDFDIQED